MRRLLLALACLVAPGFATVASATATEPLDIRQVYAGYSDIDISHIVTYNTYANGAGTTNSFAIPAGEFSFADPFLKSSANPPINTYFMGTSTYGGGDHLVLALGSSFAAGIVSGGEDFNTIFSGYDEGSLIGQLKLIDTSDLDKNDPAYADQHAAKKAAIDNIFSFSDMLNGRLGTTPANGGPLTLVSFSGGEKVGEGASTFTEVAAVPEPATWAMMIVGLGVVGGALRRRRRAAAFA